MKIGLLGFGTVGKGFYELAQDCPEAEVVSVLSRRPRPELTCRVTADFSEIAGDPSVDVVVEVMGGLHPAYEYVRGALLAGKHVVTANKQLMCAYYNEFLQLAQEQGVCLRCTAAAGGGIPWLSSLERAARLDAVTKVEGILNGTTNFMLDAMTKRGADYGEILAEAQRLGYAEADPTADVEGFDARRKIVLSANVAFGVSVEEEAIPCFGIATVTAADIRAFTEAGLTCKLIAQAEKTAGGVAACVEPTLFAASAPEANVDGSNNQVSLYAGRIGKQSFFGRGAGGYPTGSNVLADCLAVGRGRPSFYTDRRSGAEIDNGALLRRYYFRTRLPFPAATERSLGPGVVTAPMTVQAAHLLIGTLRAKDPAAFMAALR